MGVTITDGSQLQVLRVQDYKGFPVTRIGCEKENCPKQALVWSEAFEQGDTEAIQQALRHAGICKAAIEATQFKECD